MKQCLLPHLWENFPVSIVVSYDDASGETIEEKRDFVLNVIEPIPMEDMTGMEDMNNGSGISKPIIIGAVVGIVIIIAIIVIVMILKHKKKKSRRSIPSRR